MVKDIDRNSKAWIELVFEGKNKEYGAYYLRRTSSRRHLWALFIVVALCVVIFLIRYIDFDKNTGEEYPALQNISDLVMLEYAPVENFVNPELPHLPAKDVIKPAPPEIVKDEDIQEIQQELMEVSGVNDSLQNVTIENSIPLVKTEPIDSSLTKIHAEPDRSPEFPGGNAELIRYIYQNIKYPEPAYKQKIRGKVICTFTINENGSVSGAKLEKGVYIFLDEEVIRVINAMPPWEPAIKNGKRVKVRYYLPVVFSL